LPGDPSRKRKLNPRLVGRAVFLPREPVVEGEADAVFGELGSTGELRAF
jgi:hypothetical protein